MTSAHADWAGWDHVRAEVSPGHRVTVEPGLKLITSADVAIGDLWRVFVKHAPPETLDPTADLAAGREPGSVYSRAFRAVGCTFADAEKRAITLVKAIDEVLADLYNSLPQDAAPVPVVPQLRADLVRPARTDRLDALREAGWPADWMDAAARESDWLRAHPADR